MVEKNFFYLGADFKFNLHIDPIYNQKMSEFDFSVEVYCSPTKSLTFAKEDLTKIDDDNYAVCGNTADLGLGTIKMMITATVSDPDIEDTTRTLIEGVNTGFMVVRQL
jgi:hypothetical protein